MTVATEQTQPLSWEGAVKLWHERLGEGANQPSNSSLRNSKNTGWIFDNITGYMATVFDDGRIVDVKDDRESIDGA